jgi:adenylate cyclase class IV
MPEELELKALVPEPEALRRLLREAGAVEEFRGRMSDRRYDRAGELGARDEVLRVRTLRAIGGAVESLIGWKGPVRRSAEGYKQRTEVELAIGSGGASPHEFLSALGYEIVHAIDREVEVFGVGGAVVRLERYPRMDYLVEVEGDAEAIELAISATGLGRSAFTADPLAEFVRRFEARTGQPAQLAEP